MRGDLVEALKPRGVDKEVFFDGVLRPGREEALEGEGRTQSVQVYTLLGRGDLEQLS